MLIKTSDKYLTHGKRFAKLLYKKSTKLNRLDGAVSGRRNNNWSISTAATERERQMFATTSTLAAPPRVGERGVQ